jgi:hypothetical protein
MIAFTSPTAVTRHVPPSPLRAASTEIDLIKNLGIPRTRRDAASCFVFRGLGKIDGKISALRRTQLGDRT